MACLEMYNKNSEHKVLGAPLMSPRISFSNDFVESSHDSHQQNRSAYSDAPVSDFEFSVSNYSMMSADELLFKGRLLPFKGKTTTLRDELQNEEEYSDDFSLKPPKNPTRLRGFLGLRKPRIGSKKSVKGEGSVENRPGFHHDDVQCSKNSQVNVCKS